MISRQGRPSQGLGFPCLVKLVVVLKPRCPLLWVRGSTSLHPTTPRTKQKRARGARGHMRNQSINPEGRKAGQREHFGNMERVET